MPDIVLAENNRPPSQEIPATMHGGEESEKLASADVTGASAVDLLRITLRLAK